MNEFKKLTLISIERWSWLILQDRLVAAEETAIMATRSTRWSGVKSSQATASAGLRPFPTTCDEVASAAPTRRPWSVTQGSCWRVETIGRVGSEKVLDRRRGEEEGGWNMQDNVANAEAKLSPAAIRNRKVWPCERRVPQRNKWFRREGPFEFRSRQPSGKEVPNVNLKKMMEEMPRGEGDLGRIAGSVSRLAVTKKNIISRPWTHKLIDKRFLFYLKILDSNVISWVLT